MTAMTAMTAPTATPAAASSRPNAVFLTLVRHVVLPAVARALHVALLIAATVIALTALLGR